MQMSLPLSRLNKKKSSMIPYSSRVSRTLLILFFLAVLGYGIFEARGIVLGPRIEVDEAPLVVSTEFVRIQGAATRIATLTMNGTAISVTEEGLFDEPLLLHEGENRIILQARDKYGNETTKTVTLIYRPDTTPTPATMPGTMTPDIAH
jgi:hypothetical protein